MSHSVRSRAHICHKYHKLYLWRKIVMLRNFGEILGHFGTFCHNLRDSCGKKLSPKSTFVEKNDKYEVCHRWVLHLIAFHCWPFAILPQSSLAFLLALCVSFIFLVFKYLRYLRIPLTILTPGIFSFAAICTRCAPPPGGELKLRALQGGPVEVL